MNTAIEKKEQNLGFSLNAENIEQALKVCDYLSKSSLVPTAYRGKPQDILVCISWGREVGLKPLQSLTSIAVINGTPGIFGPATLALVESHPEFEFILEDNEGFAYARDKVKGWEHLKDVDPETISVCVIKRKRKPETVRSFSVEDVKTAKLGNVHNSYPKLMRKYRARGIALKDSFPGALKGMEIAEVLKEDAPIINKARSGEPTARTSVSDILKNGNSDKYKDAEEAQVEPEQAETTPVQDETPAQELPSEITAEQYEQIMAMVGLLPVDRQKDLAKKMAGKVTEDEAQEIIEYLKKHKAKADQEAAKP